MSGERLCIDGFSEGEKDVPDDDEELDDGSEEGSLPFTALREDGFFFWERLSTLEEVAEAVQDFLDVDDLPELTALFRS